MTTIEKFHGLWSSWLPHGDHLREIPWIVVIITFFLKKIDDLNIRGHLLFLLYL